MPYVCTLGRGPGRWTVLRPTRKRRLCVQPATTPRSISLSLSPSFCFCTYLPSVTTWAGIPGWRAICAAPRRRSSLVARRPSPTPSDTLCQKLFLEKRVSIAVRHSIRRDALASLLISGSNAISKTISRATQRCDRNKFLRSSIVHDIIAWQFTQPAF